MESVLPCALFRVGFNIKVLTCSQSSVRPTPVSTGPWRYDGVLVCPRQSARAPSSSSGTRLSPGRSWTWSCPWSLLVQAFDSTKHSMCYKVRKINDATEPSQRTTLLTVHSFSSSALVFTLSKSSPPQFRTCLLLPSLRSMSGAGPERLGSSRKLRSGLSPSGYGEDSLM